MPIDAHTPRDLLRQVIECSARAADLNFTPLPTLGGLELMKSVTTDAILHASVTPTDSAAAKRLFRIRQLEALIKKNPFIDGSTPTVRWQCAIDKFRKVQRSNLRATKRLEFYLKHPSRMPPLVYQVLSEARLDIFRLLGIGPTAEDWDTFDRAKVFSVGVTQGLQRFGKGPVKDTNAYAKVGPEQTLTVSRGCLVEYGSRLMGGSYGSYLRDLDRNGLLRKEERNYSVVQTQPKDASVDRVIAIEPLLNGMAQQGLSAMLASYLALWGVTLSNQSRNAKLARVASLRGFAFDGFSTVDLSNASDTVLTALVRHLIPTEWFRLLDAARTQYWKLGEDDPVDTGMFSTMGNGFTFPLQCLIFAALTRACIKVCDVGDRRYRVYGDDIIIPVPATALLLEVLRFVGFTPNVSKTFVVGSFRESCGSDYLEGHDVRPVSLKDDVKLKTSRHSLFNRLQAKDPSHPVLDVLLNSYKDPFVGPAIGPAGGETTHFVAPIFVLKAKGGLRWNESTQSYSVTYTCMIPYSRKRRRVDVGRRLLAAIAGSPGERHDLRGTVRYRVGVRVTTTPFVATPTSPAWYSF